jgi:hypothetical protein
MWWDFDSFHGKRDELPKMSLGSIRSASTTSMLGRYSFAIHEAVARGEYVRCAISEKQRPKPLKYSFRSYDPERRYQRYRANTTRGEISASVCQ